MKKPKKYVNLETHSMHHKKESAPLGKKLCELTYAGHLSNEVSRKSEKLNRTDISPQMFADVQIEANKRYILVNTKTKAFFEVVVYPEETGGEKKGADDTEVCGTNEFKIHHYIAEKLNFAEGDTAALYEIDSCCYNRHESLTISLREGKIVLSSIDAQGKELKINRKYAYYSISNTRTGSNLIIPSEKIITDAELLAVKKIPKPLAKGTLCLSHAQRNMLDIAAPHMFVDKEFQGLIDKCDDEQKKLLTECYNEHYILKDVAYEKKVKILKIVNEKLGNDLVLFPILESFKTKKTRKLTEHITRFYVGKSCVALKCGRPYGNDENKSVVRLSAVNMKLLGVAEMEKVIITHRNKRVKCKVLQINNAYNDPAMLATNKKNDFDLIIGIPLHVRKELGITELNQHVKVERDTGYIFKKHLNTQLTPVLLTFFSLNVISIEFWTRIALSILSIPFISFLMFSEKRNNRGEDKLKNRKRKKDII